MHEDSYLDNYYEERCEVDHDYENGFYAANVDEGTWDEYDEYEYVEDADYRTYEDYEDYEDYYANVYIEIDKTYSEA